MPQPPIIPAAFIALSLGRNARRTGGRKRMETPCIPNGPEFRLGTLDVTAQYGEGMGLTNQKLVVKEKPPGQEKGRG